MNIIEKLKYHEDDKLNEWYEMEDRANKKFLKDIVKFGKGNAAEIEQFCSNCLPSQFSSLILIYTALSSYSNDWNAFLFQEIKRVVILAKEKRIDAAVLDILTHIELDDIYDKDETVYIDIMDFLVANLHLRNDTKFTKALLQVIDWYLIELDEDDEHAASKNWMQQITKLANEGEPSVKLEARKILKENDVETSLNRLSFLEKIKGIFK